MRPEELKAIGLKTVESKPVFDSDKKVREIRESLEQGTREKFREYERARIASLEIASRTYLD